MRNNKISFITYTALFLALLLVFQYVSKSLGQYVTGSLVNLVLIAATLTTGIYSGMIVGVLSPLLAFSLGIGPKFAQLLPFVMLGNAVLVAVYSVFFQKTAINQGYQKILLWLGAIASASVLKFLVLYFGIVKTALPFIPNLPEKQAAVLTSAFGVTQLITAVVGGVLAYAVLPMVWRAKRK